MAKLASGRRGREGDFVSPALILSCTEGINLEITID
jgi:hypothetical protein